jgi:hypothetical protein
MRSKFGLRRYAGLTMVVTFAAAFMVLFVGSAGAIVAGAGYTTTNIPPDPANSCFNGPGLVNCNIYAAKSAVWINGGPTNGTSALSDGTYFFVVGVPGGELCGLDDGTDGASLAPPTPCPENNLSDDFDTYKNRTFTVVNHHIASYIPDADVGTANHDFVNNKIRLFPYSDTTNPGGEYFMAICKYTPDDPSTVDTNELSYPVTSDSCKKDNFKIKSGSVCTENCTPTPFGTLSGAKYYDTNLNGLREAGEAGIANWAIDFTDLVANTILTSDPSGEFTVNLSPDTYTFAEEQATNTTGPPFNLPTWIQTGEVSPGQFSELGNSTTLNSDKSYTVAVVDQGVTNGLLFGNVCLGGNGGGLTLGFWSNKNGQALETAADFAMLTALNLRNGDGSARDFIGSLAANKTALSKWLLAATATNMAYMLSAQLAAMELNVAHGLSGGSLIYVGGSIHVFMTVSDVMTAANTSLGTDPLTVAANTARAYQEMLKSALDAGNNNVNFPQPDPTKCPAPAFPTP